MAYYNDYEPNHRDYRVYKYELKLTGEQVIQIPGCYKILDVKIVGRGLFIWAMVDPDGKKKNMKFYICGTGNLMPKDISMCSYVGTVLDGVLVWHIFCRETI